MNVMVIGGGGREHAIIRKLKENPRITNLYALPGNGGIAADAVCVPIGAKDIAGMVDFARQHAIDFAVVAPDDPLALGAVDALNAAGISCFGPTASAAIIESSKVFAKHLMKKYRIPTADCHVCVRLEEALEYLEDCPLPVVIKADGLALGKGVVIAQNEEEAKAALHSIMEDKIFGESGAHVVVEEFLTGPEVSVLAFTDGKAMCPMVSSMDHKRAYDGDKGPNTGGMGTISPNPFYTEAVAQQCMERIFLPTMAAMNAEGRPFKGCLYFGLMLTPDGPKVIEYNSRFGDPETQVVLPRLQTDFAQIVEAVAKERLSELSIQWSEQASACVVMASGGYPGSYPKGIEIHGLDANGQAEGVTVYHAGTKLEDGKFLTNGGRVLGITALGDTLEAALNKAYAAVENITFEGAMYRKDIGRTHQK